MKAFETKKKAFGKADSGQSVDFKVGKIRANHPEAGITRGVLKVPNLRMQELFDPCVNKIIDSVGRQIEGHQPKSILLVGGFAESFYLRTKLKAHHRFKNIPLTLTNRSTSKAVADGAVFWYIKRSVVARAARFSFGTTCLREYDLHNGRHARRRLYDTPLGKRVNHAWVQIIEKGQVVRENEEHRRSCCMVFNEKPAALPVHETIIYTHTGLGLLPDFVKSDPPVSRAPARGFWSFFSSYSPELDMSKLNDGFAEVVQIRADWTTASPLFQRCNDSGNTYWKVEFDIVLLLGKTEIKAQIAWKDREGVEKRGDCGVIPRQFL
jgi:hypothetical protein